MFKLNSKIWIINLILGIFLLVNSCKGPSYSSLYSKPNYAFLYNPSSTSLHPVMQVFHMNDSVSELVVKLFPDEMLFNKANTKGEMRSSITLNFELREIDETGELAQFLTDSVSLDYYLNKEDVNKRYYISTLFKARQGKNYYMTCRVRDNYRNATAIKFLTIDKDDIYNNQNFRVVYNKTNHMVFDPKSVTDDELKIYYRDNSIEKLYLKYYHDFQQTPPPVNIVLTEPGVYNKYDSLEEIEIDEYLSFNADKPGLFFFQLDTAIEEGLSLMRFYDGFPKMEDPEYMIRPIEYLVSTPVFKEMLSNKGKKIVVDEFWLEAASDNTERARQLIRIYYNRVFYANYYFTSYKEGWMTDRGMVFIIYGLPDIINKDHKSEEWIYLGKNMTKVLDFMFVKKENAFNDNHYILKRNDAARTFWREATLSWKNGVVFSVDNY